jgi:hypothetical protein
MRNRRSALIASTRAGGGLCGIRPGAEERSSRPRSPSSRKRRSQRYALRSPMPAATAAATSDQPCSRTRRTNSRRLFGQVLALT